MPLSPSAMAVEMEVLFAYNGGNDQNFSFAFNSRNFSDRVLRIEIVAGGAEGRAGGSGGGGGTEWAARHRKRRREEMKIKIKREEGEGKIKIKREEGVELETFTEIPLSCKQPLTTNEFPSGDNGRSDVGDSSWSTDVSPVVRVKSIYISSAILAARSPFFYKLFSNGMRESDQRHAVLRINESEEAALMELLSFMYSGNLTTTSRTLLLDVLMAADKYEVPSCMRHCSQLLRSLPMSKESALLYLEMPASVSMASAVQPLTDAAREFLANNFKDLTKPQEGLMDLPLVGIEAILSSDDLQVASEDAIYDFVLKWAHRHYPNLEERKEILSSSLVPLIRFPFMTCRKLKKVLTKSDLDKEIVSKVVLEALFYKADAPHRQRALATDDLTNKRFVERAYKYRPVKVVEFELPHQQCIVYLDLKREECANLFPSGRVYSHAFYLVGQGFFLSAHCNIDQQSSFHCFGLFLGMQEKGLVSFTVDYEFAARTRSSGDFVSKYKGNYTFTGGKAVGYRNLFGIPWTSFMADDSPYFVAGILHLRAELTIKQLPPPQHQQLLH